MWVRNTNPSLSFFEEYSACIYFPFFLLSLALFRLYTWKSATIGHFMGEKLKKNQKTNSLHLPSFLIWESRGVLVFGIVIFLPCTIGHRNPKPLNVFSKVIKLGGDYGQFLWKCENRTEILSTTHLLNLQKATLDSPHSMGPLTLGDDKGILNLCILFKTLCLHLIMRKTQTLVPSTKYLINTPQNWLKKMAAE